MEPEIIFYYVVIALALAAGLAAIYWFLHRPKPSPKKTPQNQKLHPAIDALAKCRDGEYLAWAQLETILQDHPSYGDAIGLQPKEKADLIRQYRYAAAGQKTAELSSKRLDLDS